MKLTRVTCLIASVFAFTLGYTALPAAQDFIYNNFRWGYVDHELPAAPPCYSSHSVQPWLYDSTPWFIWTCDDGRVIARRFFTAYPAPYQGPQLPYPGPTPTPAVTGCATVKPGADWVCVNGGWLPR